MVINRALRILLVEDDETLHTILVQYLSLDHHVTATARFQDAKDLIDQEQEFDLLITDFQLPDGNGYMVAIDFRKLNPDTPIILATGSSTTLPEIQNLLALPKTSLLEKPYTPSDLEKLIIEATQRRLG